MVGAESVTNAPKIGARTATAGNLGLMPYESQNFDAAVEWYYKKDNYISLNYFQKHVTNFLTETVTQQAINGSNGKPVTDPAAGASEQKAVSEVTAKGERATPQNVFAQMQADTGQATFTSQPGDPAVMWDVTTPSNANAVELHGIELAIQHVGEGTWPSIRETLKQIGVSETAFLQACDASFKQGSQFVGWARGAGEAAGDAYLHPFTLPALDGEDLVAALARGEIAPQRFADAVCAQAGLCAAGLAPKLITHPEYAGAADYAYHLDAGKFGAFLRRHCTDTLGVEHLDAEVVRVDADDRGDICGLGTRDGRVVDGDLFVNCSGFSALLIGGHYDAPFRACRDVLFIDRAWTVQVPYAQADAPVSSVTLSTAQSAGWIWDIGLSSRRGVGHVFASDYAGEEAALAEPKAYLGARGADPEALSYRQDPHRAWPARGPLAGQLLAVGLSAGFIEPLEASAIALVEMSAKLIADVFPRRRSDLERTGRLFNDAFALRWDRIIAFLKLHYVLSARQDTAFWIDNRRPESLPESSRSAWPSGVRAAPVRPTSPCARRCSRPPAGSTCSTAWVSAPSRRPGSPIPPAPPAPASGWPSAAGSRTRCSARFPATAICSPGWLSSGCGGSEAGAGGAGARKPRMPQLFRLAPHRAYPYIASFARDGRLFQGGSSKSS